MDNNFKDLDVLDIEQTDRFFEALESGDIEF